MRHYILIQCRKNLKIKICVLIIQILTLGNLQSFGEAPVENSANDPYVVKIYPDGAKIIVRWSELGKALDKGNLHGGAPKIVSYNPSRDGIPPDSKNLYSTAELGSVSNIYGQGNQEQDRQAIHEPVGSVVSTEEFSPYLINKERRIIIGSNEDYGSLEGFTFRAGIGISYQGDLSTSGTDVGQREVAEVDFSPGIRFDLTPGWNFNEYIRLELSTAFVYNQAHSLTINGETYYASNNFGFSSTGLYQVPIMPQITFSLPVCKEVDLFLGGGFGANFVYGMLLGELPDNTLLTDNINSGSSSSWNYAWQLSAGVDWTVMPGLDVEFSYKLLSTINPTIDAWEGDGASQGPTQTFYNSTAAIGLCWRF